MTTSKNETGKENDIEEHDQKERKTKKGTKLTQIGAFALKLSFKLSKRQHALFHRCLHKQNLDFYFLILPDAVAAVQRLGLANKYTRS